MKIQYTPEERLRARDYLRCADCTAPLNYQEAKVYGRIFCSGCWDKKFDKIKQMNLCLGCAACGVERENVAGYDACYDHLSLIGSYISKIEKIRNEVDRDG